MNKFRSSSKSGRRPSQAAWLLSFFCSILTYVHVCLQQPRNANNKSAQIQQKQQVLYRQPDSSAFCGVTQTLGFILTSSQQSWICIANIIHAFAGYLSSSLWTLSQWWSEASFDDFLSWVRLHVTHSTHLLLENQNLLRILHIQLLPLTGICDNSLVPLNFFGQAQRVSVCIEHPSSLHHSAIST